MRELRVLLVSPLTLLPESRGHGHNPIEAPNIQAFFARPECINEIPESSLIDVVLVDAVLLSHDLQITDLRVRFPGAAIMAVGVSAANFEVGTDGELTLGNRNENLQQILFAPLSAAHDYHSGSLIQSTDYRSTSIDPSSLTSRELQIVVLVRVGMINKRIGQQLGITEGTVKNHVHRILGKLGLKRRTELAGIHRRDV